MTDVFTDRLSIIIPAHNEAENLIPCITGIEETLDKKKIDREIIVVNDNSTDNTKEVLGNLGQQFNSLKVIENTSENGFGRAVRLGLNSFSGDAVAIMMADLSDSPQDLVRYWEKLQEGHECVFGSRFCLAVK